ncbi:FadR family transcriptional regulator [Amycolatopsis acidicola]|uniref:FadR family transcriptional regulator n=1 Tax=Amycolatopsis acidicola TaxID=2596893 RepID=A0A5N0V8N9_9PSEU|nr:FCD domain-containing protein [Amycolatopsis acidicola]KAA9160892.1 FadR family transcriptional regulator [Amycolatopsis acidicola]
MSANGSHESAGRPGDSGRGAGSTAGLRVQRLRPAYRQVADELRAQIVAGVLPAGERLPPEPELAQLFGVSRGTVREALRVLASQHLLETARGVQGGSFVAEPDPAQLIEDLGGALGLLVMTPRLSVADLLEARLLLEPAAARLAAERADPETIEAVLAAAKAPRDARDPSGFAPHIDFHTTVLMATGNAMLAMMLQPVSDVLRTRLERSRAHDHELWAEIDACHLVLAEAIGDGDGERAETLMREHLGRLRPLYEEIDRLQRAESGESR